MSFRSFFVLLVAAGMLAAGCSSSASKAASSARPAASATTTTVALGGAYTRPACPSKPTAPVVATRVPGSDSDFDVVSFDGTRIRVHWFPLSGHGSETGAPTWPTMLKGPGWGQPGDTNVAGSGYGLFGDLGIHALNVAGYNVLTWDPRGFGKSGGTVETDSPDFEGRDVVRLIDWVAQQPSVQLDGKGDPRVGMVGASYGGGIQLVTAAIDCRVEAIVPQIAWHSLDTSLYKAQTVKSGWGDLLYSIAKDRPIDPQITSAYNDGKASGAISAADQRWFVDRGPGDLVRKITAPTLFEQGTIDTLFPLEEAVTNFRILRTAGVPTAMFWMCSGHGVCLTKAGDQKRPGAAAIAWLNRYVKGDTKVTLGPRFEYVDQNGVDYTADDFPPRAAAPVTASGRGALTLVAGDGSGPAHATGDTGVLGGVALAITPAKASHAANVPITIASAANVVGAPQLTLRYSGSSPAGVRPTRVFAQLVDDATGVVLGNQVTPIGVVLDGQEHTTTVPLEMVAFTAVPGARLTLQLVATTVSYAPPRLGGSIDFRAVQVELPTVTGVTRHSVG